MSLEINLMLCQGPIEVGPGNKGFFTYPFVIPRKEWRKPFIMNLKLLNQFIIYMKFKKTTIKQIR